MDTTATPSTPAAAPANDGAMSAEAAEILADLGVSPAGEAAPAPAAADAAKPADPEAKPEEKPPEKPKNGAERALGAKFAEAHRREKAAKAAEAAAAAKAAEYEAKHGELAKREERVTAWEKALAGKDLDTVLGTLEAAGVTFDVIVDHLASKGKALSPEEKAAKETADRLARLEREAEEGKKAAEARAKAEAEAAEKAKTEEAARMLNAHVSLAQDVAQTAGYATLPREAAERAVAIVHHHWRELGEPEVSEADYRQAIGEALGRVEQEFEARGLLLKKAPKAAAPAPSANAASGSETAQTPSPMPGANEAPRTITGSTVSSTPIVTPKPVSRAMSHEEALEWAISQAQ